MPEEKDYLDEDEEEEFEEELERFRKIEKVGLSISVDKKNLEKLRDYMRENDPDTPISFPFNSWLEEFILRLDRYKRKQKHRENQLKKESDNDEKK